MAVYSRNVANVKVRLSLRGHVQITFVMLNGNWSLLPTIPVFNRLLSEWKTNQNQINKYTAFWKHISSYEGNSHKNYSLQFFCFLLFYISFYISTYFSPAFRIQFNIIWKTIFVTNLPFLTDPANPTPTCLRTKIR